MLVTRYADVSEAVVFPLSIRVICDLLGVPAEDQDRFRGWTDRFLSTGKERPRVGRAASSGWGSEEEPRVRHRESAAGGHPRSRRRHM